MSRTVRKSWTSALPLAVTLAAFGAVFLSTAPVGAQEESKPKAKDDALDSLLKEIKDEKKAESTPKNDKSDAKKKDEPAPSKPVEPPGAKAKPAPKADGSKKPAEVAPKDKELDNLLEKLGTSDDKPTPEDRRGGGGMPPPDDKEQKPQPGDGGKPPKAKPDELTGKSKDLDEHLEELTGKSRKKKNQKDDGNGPMSELVKQMREVEQRLNQPDTGEETRKKQQQIVKNLDSLIEQMRSQSNQSKGKQRQIRMKPGGPPQPGQNQGQDPGTTGGNAPHTKPAKPENKRSLAGGKDEWGHLPPELRQEMDNVFKEDFLTSRADLIERYYNALTKKKVKRGE